MAFQVSPGVVTKEVDKTNVVPPVSSGIGVMVGHFSKGPVEEITIINTEEELVNTFGKPNADVYIGTSDKVDPEKSPFNFQEKRLIAKAHSIDPSKVLLAPRPYHNMDYEANFQHMSDQFDPDNVEIFLAVGEKDVGERFPMNNVDEKTG